MKIYIDGQYYSQETAKISVFDHGLLYGDGVFEGIRSYNGRVFKLSEHLKRLYESASAILLQIPLSIEEMEQSDDPYLTQFINGHSHGPIETIR